MSLSVIYEQQLHTFNGVCIKVQVWVLQSFCRLTFPRASCTASPRDSTCRRPVRNRPPLVGFRVRRKPGSRAYPQAHPPLPKQRCPPDSPGTPCVCKKEMSCETERGSRRAK